MRSYGFKGMAGLDCCPGHTSWAVQSKYTAGHGANNADGRRRPFKKRARQFGKLEIQDELNALAAESYQEMRAEAELAQIRAEFDLDNLDNLHQELIDDDWAYDLWDQEEREASISEAQYYDDMYYDFSTGTYGPLPNHPGWIDVWLAGSDGVCWRDFTNDYDWYDDMYWCTDGDYPYHIPDAPWVESGNKEEVTAVGKSAAQEHIDAKHATGRRRKLNFTKS